MWIHTEHILKIKKKLNQIYAQNTGQPVDVIERESDRDHYLTVEEALEFGLIDKIITRREDNAN
jgi:ATP-dependent Clp protease protease subunit